MKYAIISDVHGNAPALRLALDDARMQGAEGFLFAGDYCISAPWPNEVVEMIRSLPGAHVIRGNNDEQADKLAQACRQELGKEPDMTYCIGGVIAINAGPNLVGLLYWA